MKSVVIFNGSPRYDGNTATILNMIERGAKEHYAQVKRYDLLKMRFMACQGCFNCRINEKCIVDDELTSAMQIVKDADALVIGSPVYFMQVNGMVKNLYDRLFPLIGKDGKPRYGEKKIVTVYTQDYQDTSMFNDYFDYVASTFPTFGLVDEKRIVCGGANDPETAEKNYELKNYAYQVGTALATE